METAGRAANVEEVGVGREAKPLGLLSWSVLAVLLVHVAEELPGFPEWATRHFGTTSTAYFVLSHIPLIATVLWIVQRAARPGAADAWIWLLLVVQVTLGVNGLFHLAATLWFGDYSPGVVTGLALYLPLTFYLLPRAARRLGPLRTATACCVGTLVSALLVCSLWLDVTFV